MSDEDIDKDFNVLIDKFKLEKLNNPSLSLSDMYTVYFSMIGGEQTLDLDIFKNDILGISSKDHEIYFKIMNEVIRSRGF
jgi:hypothetical protein